MKNLMNSLIALAGLAIMAVAAPILLPFTGLGASGLGGNAPVSQTQNVLVVNSGQQPLPVTGSATVTGTVQAQQNGTWNVGISGTPTVNVFPTQTIMADDETLLVPVGVFRTFEPIDVSRFKEIKVIVSTISGSINFQLFPRILNQQNPVDVILIMDDINGQQTGRATITYDLPGGMMDFFLDNVNGQSDTTVRIVVLGRTN